MSPSSPRTFKNAAYGHVAELGKALSSAARVEILELLSQAPRTVEVLAGQIEQSVANTSHHLQALKRAQLVATERDGLHVIYSLAGADVAALVVQLQTVAAQHIAALDKLAREFFDEADGLEGIDRDSLVAGMQAGDIILLDVRPAHEFAARHLPDAISVPLAELESRLHDLPRDRTIVAYCRGRYCTLSADAARRLRALGYDARRTDASVHSLSAHEHWDAVYADKAPDSVSWYQPRLEQSLAWIDGCELPATARIADIGGGASTLVDDLLTRGFDGVSVVDISERALERSRQRLGREVAQRVRWVVGDVTSRLFGDDSIDLWHDRAVFHFMTDDADRKAYLAQVARCVRPGGFVIIATFGPDGPERCSGLPVRRHTSAQIAQALGPRFELFDQADEVHVTPSGTTQAFAYALCRRRATNPNEENRA